MPRALPFVFILCALLTAQAQTRRPRPPTQPPAAGPAQETAKPPAPPRRVTVSLNTGDPVVGEFAGASGESLYVSVAGNRLTLRWADVAAVQFGDARPAAVSAPAQAPAGTLTIEAGIIYKVGGNQPVARTAFHLLDASLEQILRDAGLRPDSNIDLISTYALAYQYPDQSKGFFAAATAAIKPHILQTVTTDFSGKAQFEPAQPGHYYVHGISGTRKGFAIWNVPVELQAGANSLLLDQNNAASAF